MLTKNTLAGLMMCGAIWLPAAADAQQSSVDPDAGSPAGTVYELPLDSARQDAAPKKPSKSKQDKGGSDGAGAAGSGSSGSGGGTGGGTPSAIRSENGFGSSDSVPGADDGGSGSARAGGDGPVAGRDQTPSSTVDATKTAQTDDPSGAGVYILLGLVLLVAAAIGLATRGRRGVDDDAA